jgi:hypothetical protein
MLFAKKGRSEEDKNASVGSKAGCSGIVYKALNQVEELATLLEAC